MEGYPERASAADAQRDAKQGGDFIPSRRYIGTADHMQSEGVSAPVAVSHGYGRRHLIPEDHQVTRDDYVGNVSTEDARLQHGQGRKLIVPFDHMKCDVLKPVEDIAPVKVPTGQDMKEAVRDWLVSVHTMFVSDERKWDQEVSVEPCGCHWVCEALTQQKKSISREGPSARLIAEKLAMMPNSELRYFGLRFAGPNDPKPIRREKHGTFDENRSMISPGVQDAISRDRQQDLQKMSSTRKHPEDVQRRYISSGQDHFLGATVKGGDVTGSHGHSKDDDFDDTGLERGMGHGKRFIGCKDHLFGGGAA